MKLYKVGLSRLYNVYIEVENKADAKQAIDTFLSSPKDISRKKRQRGTSFQNNRN